MRTVRVRNAEKSITWSQAHRLVEESFRWHPNLSRAANPLRPSFPSSNVSSRKRWTSGRFRALPPRSCKTGLGAHQGLWPSRCRSRLAGDNRHTLPDLLDHKVVHRHGLGLADG